MLGIILMMFALLFLLATVASTIFTLLPGNDTLPGVKNWFLPVAAAGVVVLRILPRRWRESLDSMTIFVLALAGYVAGGIQRNAAVARLGEFLMRLTNENRYERIHIVAYSMGSIIVLDALFPRTKPLGAFRTVDGLVTIGCPADIIQMYWPDYFRGRHRPIKKPAPWINIFIPSDLLASNFIARNTNAETPEEARSEANDRTPRTSTPDFNSGVQGVPPKASHGDLQLIPQVAPGSREPEQDPLADSIDGPPEDPSHTEGDDHLNLHLNFGRVVRAPGRLIGDASGKVKVASEKVWEASGPAVAAIGNAPGKYFGRPMGQVMKAIRGPVPRWSGIQVPPLPDDHRPEEVRQKDGCPDRNVSHPLISVAGGLGSTLSAMLAVMWAHRSYWHMSEAYATGAFDTIVRELPLTGNIHLLLSGKVGLLPTMGRSTIDAAFSQMELDPEYRRQALEIAAGVDNAKWQSFQHTQVSP